MNIKCLRCKGAEPLANCGRTFCPIVAKAESMFKVQDRQIGENFSGSAPTPFVGRYGYPYVNVGILSTAEHEKDAWLYDAPKYWSEHDFDIRSLIDLRSALINSRFKASVKQTNKFLDISKEVGIAEKPVEVEVQLEKKPSFRLSKQAGMAPTGPNAKLKHAEITSNPKIDRKVDKVVSDTDLKARDGVIYLYEHEFDENTLSRILSVGELGLKHNRKLVPTRWSITATDDMLAKHLLDEIKDFPAVDYLAYFGSYLGNYYLIMLFPEVWSYELFEMYAPNTSWNIDKQINYTTDHEPYNGRKTYAENCAGGYYSVRLAVLEHLRKIKKQASVLTLRFITGEYAVPLGVWVTREAARKAMNRKPIEFASKELMLKYTAALIKKKFGFDINSMLANSVLLKNIKYQRKILEFI